MLSLACDAGMPCFVPAVCSAPGVVPSLRAATACSASLSLSNDSSLLVPEVLPSAYHGTRTQDPPCAHILRIPIALTAQLPRQHLTADACN